MGVVNGQPVSAEITNPAYIDANQNDQGFGIYDFVNTDALSGDFVFNLQQNINNQIQNHKLFLKLSGDQKFSWSAPSLSFPSDIQIVMTDLGFTNLVLAANSPITLNEGESVYVTLTRTANATLVPHINTIVPSSKDVFRIATRLDNDLVLYDNTLIRNGGSLSPGEGGASAVIKADYLDPSSTTLPVGSSYVADGTPIVNGQTVLFTALTSGANQIYKVSGVGTSLVWTTQLVFPSGTSPTVGDSVRIRFGNSFASQLAVFDNVSFKVNNVVRFFNGADYWEASSMQTQALANNTTGNIFTLNFSGSENMIAHFSVVRNSIKETGSLHITTDGAVVAVSESGAYTGLTGVSFTADIVGATLRLRYTTDNSGFTGTMKYFVLRWSDLPGGPGGPASYGSGGGAPVTAAGSTGQVQFNNMGLLAADPDFTWDATFNVLGVGGIQFAGQQVVTLSDNVMTPTTAFSYTASAYPFAVIEYSVSRNGNMEVGSILVATDGSLANASYTNTYVPSFPGVVFTAAIVGATVAIQYVSSSTGFNATLKYSMRRWS